MLHEIDRRQFLSLAAVAALGRTNPGRLIIDTHVEVWTIDPKYPFHWPEDPTRKPQEPATVEDEVDEMRDFGIKYTVLVNPRYYGWNNSYISYSLHKYPKLFVAHGLVNPLDPDAAGRLRYWVKEHGFQGMRLSPLYAPESSWLNSKEDYPLWREAERLGAVFNFFILPHQMPMLEDMAGRFPGVKIIIDHLGMPRLKDPDPWTNFRKMFRLKRFPQVWVKTHGVSQLSATGVFPYRDTFPFFKATYEEFGPSKLLWGVGCVPKPKQAQAVNEALEFVDKIFDFYGPEDRELILGKNALRIWKFPKG
jgi:predicted TIM-barrel fold metal-dependent hydrolase